MGVRRGGVGDVRGGGGGGGGETSQSGGDFLDFGVKSLGEIRAAKKKTTLSDEDGKAKKGGTIRNSITYILKIDIFSDLLKMKFVTYSKILNLFY